MSESLLSVKIYKNGALQDTIVFSENQDKEEYKVYQGIIRIGRMSTSHIKLNDTQIPRLHATIENSDGNFIFTLMGISKTLYNGEEISGKLELNKEDKIEIADWKIVFFPKTDLTEEDLTTDNQEISSAEQLDGDEPLLREVVSTIPEGTVDSSVKLANELLESDENLEYQTRRAQDRITNPYFSVDSGVDDTPLQKSVGKGIEIKHYWQGTLRDANLYKSPQIVKIGADDEDDFFVEKESLPENSSFTIMDPSKDGNFNVYFLPNKVHYIEGQEEYNLDELLQAHKAAMKTDNKGAIRLLFRTRIAFEVGEHRFEVSSVPVFRSTSKFSLATIKEAFNPKFNFISIVLHLLVLLVLFLTPPAAESYSIEKLNEIPERYARVILDVPKEEKIKKVVKFETKEVGKKVTKFKSKGKSNLKFEANVFNDKGLTQKQIKDKRIVHSKGMLGLMKKTGGLGGMGGGGTYGGIQDDNLRLTDNTNVSGGASGAPGIRGGGSGPGGGGTGIGVGGPSTGGGGYGPRFKGGYVGGKRGPKVKRKLKVSSKGGMVTGNLTKQQIQRVVNKNIMEVRYCYEKELSRKPELKGSMLIQWKINPQGKVIFVKVVGGTLKDNGVKSCLRARIARWKFPEPKGGGYALVKYPFNFRSN